MSSTPIRLSSRLRHVLTSALALFTFATLVACGTNLDSNVVEFNRRHVEVVETGTGDATVVFESGLGADWTPWDVVATNVARSARVFAYSRPGNGDSDQTTDPRDATHIVDDLRGLLAARGYTPPYVLVGHSFGGTYMELFAKKYPEDVAGLVLVDPRHRDLSAACEEARLDGCIIPASTVASLPSEQRAEFEAFATVPAEIGAAGTFGAYPVRVLTATSHGFSSELEALWQSMLGSLADEASDGQQIIYRGAGHYIQLDRAKDVTDVILSLIPPQGG
jgi:pimeloyl-ACP methyl ester carboxylesterase